jgi:hypothetical protein
MVDMTTIEASPCLQLLFPSTPYNLSTIPKRSSLPKAVTTKIRLKKNVTRLKRNTGKYKEGESVTAVREIGRGQIQRIFVSPTISAY